MSFIKLKYGNIKGDSSEATHEGWIDISSFAFGSNRSVSNNQNGMRQIGIPNISEIKIEKPICSATPLLMNESWGGNAQDIEFNFLQETPNGLNIISQYKLFGSTISGHSVRANGQGEILENYSISFTKIEISMQKFDSAGKATTNTAGGYDLQKHQCL